MGKYDIFESKWAYDIFKQKYAQHPNETWPELARRVVENVVENRATNEQKEKLTALIAERKFIPAGRYLYAAGREFHQYNNCFLFRAEDSREGWADLLHKSSMSLMTGGGIGVDYSPVRPEGYNIKKTGGTATGPVSLMQMVNENGRHIMQGGARRSAIWAGLSWWHPDIYKFMEIKNWSDVLRQGKKTDPHKFPLPMELTNISVIYDTAFFDLMDIGRPVEINYPWGGSKVFTKEDAEKLWMLNCRQAFQTAEPGFSFNYLRFNESLRNACTEVVSSDDSDKCNLGTLWLNRFSDKEEFQEAIPLAVLFLLCGGITSDLPTEKIREIGNKNNRIGLGIGGVHEWLMTRHSDYEVTDELRDWLEIYHNQSNSSARIISRQLGVSDPEGVRAIAPNGTIGIIAETTTAIEPLFCIAYKREFVNSNQKLAHQFVIDGAVKRLVAKGIPISAIKDAYDIPFEQRVKMQADVQDYVDMGISSTCNIPAWGTEKNNEQTVKEYATILYKYAKSLRGFTCYPDGSRGFQPLERVSLEKALAEEGKVFEEREHQCTNGICGV